MRSLSILEELRELLDITQLCAAQALAAQRQAARYSDCRKFQAAEFKKQAARARSPELQESFLRIAASYERLAKRNDAVPQPFSGTPVVRTTMQSLEEAAVKPAESALAQARRHVAMAEDHVARQQTLTEQLSKDDRYSALAAEAREILATLEHTLILARQHLSIELKK